MDTLTSGIKAIPIVDSKDMARCDCCQHFFKKNDMHEYQMGWLEGLGSIMSLSGYMCNDYRECISRFNQEVS